MEATSQHPSRNVTFDVSRLEKEKKYWLDKLSGQWSKTVFPYDMSPARRDRFPHENLPFQIDTPIFRDLMKLRNGSDPRLHMILTAAFIALLYRYTRDNDREKDIITGAPIYRQEKGGNFTNTLLVLRNPVTTDMTFKQLLLQVRGTISEAVANQAYPIERLKEELDFVGEPGDFAFFDSALILENIHDPEYISAVAPSLTLSLTREEQSIGGVVRYNAARYRQSTIRDFAKRYIHIIRQVLADIDIPLDRIDILTAGEKKFLLEDLNDTARENRYTLPIHQLFQEQVRKTPDRVALVTVAEDGGTGSSSFGQYHFSYRQLNERANRLARILKNKGMFGGFIAGIMIEPSSQMAAALLAVLKAGGAYLPIDTGLPASRVLYMLEDSGCRILLSTSSAVRNFSFSGLLGFQTREQTPAVLSPARPHIAEFGSMDRPDRSLIDLRNYKNKIGMASVTNCISLQSTRGCPYECLYCHKIWSKRHVYRTAEHIFDEIQYFYQNGVTNFAFIDDCFNLNSKNSSRLFQLLLKHKIDVQIFFPNGLRGDIMTPGYIDLMVEAGTRGINLSLETASPRLQTLLKKHLDLDKFKNVMDYIASRHPEVVLEMASMHGFPGETEEEAIMTLNFIKNIRWLHFPYIHILKIFPNTEMEEFALRQGVSKEAIMASKDLAFHELPETLPFPKRFTRKYQANFLNDYFLSRERLTHVLPHQMKVLSPTALVQKYNAYLPVQIDKIEDIIEFAGLQDVRIPEDYGKEAQPRPSLFDLAPVFLPSYGETRKILFLDLSQHFSSHQMLYSVAEQPLGAIYLLTYLKKIFGSRIDGRIYKAGNDFNSFPELKRLVDDYRPHVIGLRALTFFKDFFHETAAMLRQWGFDVPIITGGPYASSDFDTILKDPNIDLVVFGEGEYTLEELIRKMFLNDFKIPGPQVLKTIPGLAFREHPLAPSRQVLLLDRLSFSDIYVDAEDPDLPARPDQPAYVMYTSGSTGSPKGVMVEHNQVNNCISWMQDYFNLIPGDIVVNRTNLSFDPSVWEIFWPLYTGACVKILDAIQRKDADFLARLMEQDSGATLMYCPSTLVGMMNVVLNARKTEPRLTMPRLLIGAEPITPEILENFYRYYEGQITNTYGPTEGTINNTYHPLPPEGSLSVVPIGKPVSNNRIYILDHHMRPVPPGQPGEICIAGDSLARGYVNNPEKTHQSFIPEPFGPGRLYKTGDIGRWLPEGVIEIMGRIDEQVKIRGYRIEPGEIEHTLSRHPAVRECIVQVKEPAPGPGESSIATCRQCGITSRYPNVHIQLENGDHICSLCKFYWEKKTAIDHYFKNPEQLKLDIRDANKDKTGPYDCILLYNGGRGAAFALYHLVDMGFNVMVLSYDNGYFSRREIDNIKKITCSLGLNHEVLRHPQSDNIMKESCKLASTVCRGCFHVSTTLAGQYAYRHGIKVVVGGTLSRGQIIENKLLLFLMQNITDTEELEREIDKFQRSTPEIDKSIFQYIDIPEINNGSIHDKVTFMDFYRYHDISNRDMIQYLNDRDPYWKTRKDFAIYSTNCSIKQIGDFAHLEERGFHYYGSATSWEKRLNHINIEDLNRDLTCNMTPGGYFSFAKRIDYIPPSRKKTAKPTRHLCAYFIPAPEQENNPDIAREIRDYLGENVPSYMVPDYFIPLDRFPLTPNGKLDKNALPSPDTSRLKSGADYIAPQTSTEKIIAQIWRDVLDISMSGINDNFFDLGGNSLNIVQVNARLNQELDREIPVVAMFNYPTIASLAAHLGPVGGEHDSRIPETDGQPVDETDFGTGQNISEKRNIFQDIGNSENDEQETLTTNTPRETQKAPDRRETGLEIAVIGMAGRFPGASDIHEFWDNLKNGVECISFFSESELIEAGIPVHDVQQPNYVKAKGIMAQVDCFDAAFFDYSVLQAELMDPQTRIFHECCWHALEDAGYTPDEQRRIGLYAGATDNVRWIMEKAAARRSPAEEFEIVNLNSNSFSSLISYKLNLKGPAVTVQTACSTSLVAVDLACQGLLTRKCHIALAGGVTVALPHKCGYFYQEGMIMSPDGRCRAFDKNANGTVGGDGVGVVVLKRLKDALDDRDYIYAVILGSAINNDGLRKVGYTAPSIDGQVEVIHAAHETAAVQPHTIGYIETHGTGTPLGDPIEIEALKIAFSAQGKDFRCKIGAVKTNIGHLDSAAGIAGFIKTVLILKHGIIPPTLYFREPSLKSGLQGSPFSVITRLTPWQGRENFPQGEEHPLSGGEHPLRAGVSSFGIGGTNAHVILEQGPLRKYPADDSSQPEPQLILMSARTPESLWQTIRNLGNFLKDNSGLHLPDVAYTLQVGRKPFKERAAVVAFSTAEAAAALTTDAPGIPTRSARKENRPVIFMFSGQGNQYENMGLQLYRTFPVFRDAMDRCFQLFHSFMGFNLKSIIFTPVTTAVSPGHSTLKRIDNTEIAQPALFCFEYALAHFLMHLGITPRAMIGHSIGEYVAACLSGVFSLEDAIRIVSIRGALMQNMPPGAMLGVPLSPDRIRSLAGARVSLAAVNGPERCVVSGPFDAVEEFREKLDKDGVQCRKLHTSHAFHSQMMEPAVAEFRRAWQGISMKQPRIPYISNVTGTWISSGQAVDPGYWAQHLREPVRFSDGLQVLLAEENALLVEIGPGNSLTTFTRQHPSWRHGSPVIQLVPHPRETAPAHRFFLENIGRMWLNGAVPDWSNLHSHRERFRIPLPLYPFEARSFPVDFSTAARIAVPASKPVLTKRPHIGDWFYVPTWQRTAGSISSLVLPGPTVWMIFATDRKITPLLSEAFVQSNDDSRVITVAYGTRFSAEPYNDSDPRSYRYTLDPLNEDHYRSLFRELQSRELIPGRIVHLAGLQHSSTLYDWMDHIDGDMDNGFFSLLFLTRALGSLDHNHPIHIDIVSRLLHDVTGSDSICPTASTLLAPLHVIPIEYPQISCRNIDIDPAPNPLMVKQILNELARGHIEPVVAYRGKYRWIPGVASLPSQAPGTTRPPLKKNGVYLITGGLGGIGLQLARYLSRTWNARLVLTTRSPIPSAPYGEKGYIPRKMQEVEQLRESGAKVLVFSADVTDFNRMKTVIDDILTRFGQIDGVIHAAGIPDGAIIEAGTRRKTREVLAPKIHGTVVLHRLLQDMELDFFMLCSSLNSILVPPGQVGYAAANLFLDAFAHFRVRTAGGVTLSVNWDAWQEVGMAARSLGREVQILSVEYPLFHRGIVESGGKIVYSGTLNPQNYWVLNEHRIMGLPTLPGAAYIEIARAAFHAYTKNLQVEIRDVYFLNPLVVSDHDEREMRIVLRENSGGFDFTVMSKTLGTVHQQGNWEEHARGRLNPLSGDGTLSIESTVEQLESRLSSHCVTLNQFQSADMLSILKTGPRWDHLQAVMHHINEGLARLELPSRFAPDLQDYSLHPALLDSATAFLSSRYQEQSQEAYAPFFYKRIEVKRPFTSSLYSYARGLDVNRPGSPTIAFDIVIFDEDGREAVYIEEFTMMKISRQHMAPPSSSVRLSVDTGKKSETDYDQLHVSIHDTIHNPLYDPLKYGISPDQGVQVFTTALASGETQVIVSTRDLPALLKSDPFESEDIDKPDISSTAPHRDLPDRPDLETPYVAPANEVQKKLAHIFSETFVIETTGINDDFFQLGGDSLKAITVASKIHKALDIKIPVSEFFTHPTIKQLELYISSQSDRESYTSIQPVEKREYYPLSSPQKRLFIQQQVQPDSVFYNLPQALILEGKPSREKFDHAFQDLIDRHESLRTSFRITASGPVQVISSKVPFQVTYSDAPGLQSESPSEPDIDALIDSFVRPFDLEHAPLLRVEIIRLSYHRDRYLCLFDIHHIISDASGCAILQKELLALIDDQMLPPVNITYKDYAVWQTRYAEEGSIARSEAYWLDVYPDKIPRINFPIDFPRPGNFEYRGEGYRFTLKSEETQKLKEAGSNADATLFMNLLALLNILLFKYTGQEDIVVGCSTAGRQHADLQDIIGMFVNMLPLRNFPFPVLTYRDFLQKVKEVTLGAFTHQDMQFDDLVFKLQQAEEHARQPLLEVCLNLENYEHPSYELEGLKVTAYRLQNKTAKFPIMLWANEVDGEIKFLLEYSTELFSSGSIEKFARRYLHIIEQTLDNPDICLRDIELPHDYSASKTAAPEIEFDF